MNKNKTLDNLFLAIFSVFLVLFVIIAGINVACFFDKSFLYKLILKYKTYNELPFKLDLTYIKQIADELMNYLSGNSAFLETRVPINGTMTEFYSLRSKIHMADVKNLFKTITYVGYFAIIITIISGFKLIRSNYTFKDLKKSYLKALIAFAFLIIILTIFAILNFDTFFISFHKLVFTNDYWLLDPDTDYIICLLPEQIFMIYGKRILSFIVLFLLAVFLCLQLLSKILPRQEAK